jgi:hypothetical protein
VIPNQPDTAGPRIDIHLGQDSVDIRQQRPAIARALAGLPVEAALARIPMLLPICGAAQAIAAAGAVAAARRQAPDREQLRKSDQALCQEQALACAWRLTVDWADLLGEARQMAALKTVYQAAGERERSAALRLLAKGLEEVDSLDKLMQWVGASDSLAARVIRLAREAEAMEPAAETPAPMLDPGRWREAASAALACEPFDHLDPAGSPLQVGPLAMGRDPLLSELQAAMGSTVMSRLLAQLLDVRAVIRALAGNTDYAADVQASAWSPSEPAYKTGNTRYGIGCAVTARGPVFHRVALAPAVDTVMDWRVLAPTDWHFGPRGPVAARLGALAAPTRRQVALLVASYDPCAPWALHLQAGD